MTDASILQLEGADACCMGPPGDTAIETTKSFFIYDLKPCKKSYKILGVVNQTSIVDDMLWSEQICEVGWSSEALRW